VIETTKTRGSRRTVHLPAPVVDALRKRATIQEQERLRAADEWTTEPTYADLVFTTAFGTPIDSPSFAGLHRSVAGRRWRDVPTASGGQLTLKVRSPRSSVPSANKSTMDPGIGEKSLARMKSRIEDPVHAASTFGAE
jgi:integrase